MYIRLTILLFFISVIASGQDIGGQYYVAHPDSTYSGMNTASDSNDGSYLNPWATWQKAFDTADKFDTVYFRGGVYYATAMHPEVNSLLVIDPYGEVTDGVGNDGGEDSLICYFAYPDETPIFDGANVENAHGWFQGLDLERCNFIHFKGLTIRNVRQGIPCTLHGVNGYGCSNLTFEQITLTHIGGKGYSLNSNFGALPWFAEQSDLDTNAMRFINCDVSYCMDSLARSVGSTDYGNYADGYWMIDTDTLTTSFEFTNCRSFMNSDDGWDIPFGGVTHFKGCWSFNNGHLDHGIGEGIRHAATNRGNISNGSVTRCIMAGNKQNAYREGYGGSENLEVYVYNNFSYNNGESGFVISKNRFDDPDKPAAKNTYRNNISYDDNVYQIYRGSATPPLYPNLAGLYAHSHNNWTVGYNMTGLPDISPTITTTSSDFVSLDINELYQPRKSDGSLPDIDFGRLAEGSDMIDAGIADTLFTQLGLIYKGSAPDLGPFEFANPKRFGISSSDGVMRIGSSIAVINNE